MSALNLKIHQKTKTLKLLVLGLAGVGKSGKIDS